MKKYTSSSLLIMFTVLTLSIAGCASTGSRDIASGETLSAEDVNYIVKAGDNLGNIAKTITGQFSNWQTIAQRNGISDPRTLATGQTLLIPGSLLAPTYPTNAQTAQNQAPRTALSTGSSAPIQAAISPLSVTTGNGVSVIRSLTTTNTRNDVVDVTVSSVEINRAFELEPINIELPAAQNNSAQFDSAAPQIRVIGTYYPKGIYAQPANYSRLIRRVAPGTLFELDSQVNDWYKIKTDEGIAYIRQRDSTVADTQASQ